MTAPIFWLTATLAMTALFWLPYTVNRISVQGLNANTAGASPTAHARADWAERAMKAHQNGVENLVVFAPLVLITAHLGINPPFLGVCAAIYFFASLVHFVVSTAGIGLFRTLAYATSWAMQLVFVFAILQ